MTTTNWFYYFIYFLYQKQLWKFFLKMCSLTHQIPQVMDINPTSCLASYKLSNDPSKTTSLHCMNHIYIMLVKLCIDNYATLFGLVNGANNIFEASRTHTNKTTIQILFQNFKFGTLIKEFFCHYYYRNIESKWTPIESIIKDIKVGKTQLFIITNIQFSIQLAITRTIHCSQRLSLDDIIFYPINVSITCTPISHIQR